ncbi:MAG: AsnC family protein [Rhodospirillales bacterium]|nr:AsnC family protein [Rhodospirillales bacterium]MDE2318402.1 AsnC family protein [Rhodospirillales bacterium]
MPQARIWTQTADQAIVTMRSGGATWAAIGRQLGLSRNTVIERGRRLNAALPLRPVTVMKSRDEDGLDDPNRPSLRAGHPLTWGLLTDAPFPEGEEA